MIINRRDKQKPKGWFEEWLDLTFPEKLIEPCILAGSPQGGMVLDLFVGSGTTMVAAIKNHRNGIGIDINSKYLEIAINRINGSTQKLF